MINVEQFCKKIIEYGSDYICGVPDSLLKMFTSEIDKYFSKHTITANEGNAIATATGYYLATKKVGVVYMQNSGLGNCINPLISLADESIYQIPMLLIIGWRGEPGIKDEPQHKKQGLLTIPLIETLGIPYKILESIEDIDYAYNKIKDMNCSFALIVKQNTFENHIIESEPNGYVIPREEAVIKVVSKLDNNYRIVSTTGMISRELYEYRENNKVSHKYDFLTVGSMGHASSIAMALAESLPEKEIIVLDGDGACIMHMGALAVVGTKKINNLKYIVLNNASHDSVGGQPTVAGMINLSEIAKNCGFEDVYCIKEMDEFDHIVDTFLNSKHNAFLEIKVSKGNRQNLGRPKESPIENKIAFMEELHNE